MPGDMTSLKKFNALLLFISGLVVAVPMISMTIFFYQSFADQYFVLVVLAVETWVVGQAFKGFLSDRKNLYITILSGALGLSGFICWATLDEQAMFVSEYLITQGKRYLIGQSFFKILAVVSNAGFNFFFSKVITAQLIARLSAEIFAHGVSGDMAYVASSDDGSKNNGETGDDVFQQTNPSFAISKSRVQYSNLASLDVWSRKVRLRSQNEAKKAGFGPYRPGTLGGSLISKMCCGAQAAEQVLDE